MGDAEPLPQKVKNVSIYELVASPENIKLQMFCSLVRSLGFRWTWSDTCCIRRTDTVVLQESITAIFRWHRGSSLTVVHLVGVLSEFKQPGDLCRSTWNARGWTYQEYVAAETIQFYTEDWKSYLGFTLSNHKESSAIISEIQQATGVSPQDVAVLRPGTDRVCHKLYLASMRRTTLVEDIAYSLFGIFDAAIPIIYGEGDRVVGRFLEQILTGSGDVTILAWTGHAGSYNSCLPVDLVVYKQTLPPHVPQPIETAELDHIATILRLSLPDLSLATMLHDRLHELPSPSCAASRLRLPGTVVRLAEPIHTSGPNPVTNHHIYRATTSTFGDIEIQTADNLTGMKDLRLAHPWIRPLLDQEFSDGATALDKTKQALRLVASDSLIIVQIRSEVLLTDLIDNILTIQAQ